MHLSMFHPDWLIRSNFRLRRNDNLHKDSHQNSWIYPRVITLDNCETDEESGEILIKTAFKK